MTQADSVLSTPPTNSSSLIPEVAHGLLELEAPLLRAQAQSRAGGVLLFLGVLTVTAVAAAYLWTNYERPAEANSSAIVTAAAPVVDRVEETLSFTDFQSSQQQSMEVLESATQNIAAQKNDLKNLSDQEDVVHPAATSVHRDANACS